MNFMYHATNSEARESIIKNGIDTRIDGVVYLAEREQDALKFVMFRNYKEITVFKVSVLGMELNESHDHSEEYFKCKAWSTPIKIPKYKLCGYAEYQNTRYKDLSVLEYLDEQLKNKKKGE